MNKPIEIYFQFEQLVEELLIANGFQIQFNNTQTFDFQATRGNDLWGVEVKYYRTERAQLSLIESAAARLANIIDKNNNMKGMLVVACNLSEDLRLVLEKKYGLVFVDRSDLFVWASKKAEIADQLTAILEDRHLPSEFPKGRDIDQSLSLSPVPVGDFPTSMKGTELRNELLTLRRGKTTWRSYEELCERILKYLFSNDLHGWHTQQRTDDGLNRFDYICRIKPTTNFWTFLLDHLNSRYVLFEFKNYTGQIKQGQILTTEKYLMERGLRRVAIIFSRTGAEKNAIKMTQGAMRENGKLILVLDDKKICDMLIMKERGEDPSDLLFEIADDFLLSLPR